MDIKPSWGIFWRLRSIVANIDEVLMKIIPTMQADIEEIKTNHIEHLEKDMSEVKTGVRLIMKKMEIEPPDGDAA